MLPFLRYALLSVLRNRRRSIYALVGIALALSMITGSFIAVDSSSVGMLKSAMDQVPVDFVGHQSTWSGVVSTDYLNVTVEAIKSVKYVENSTPVLVQYGLVIRNQAENLTYVSQSGGTQIVMIEGNPEGFFEKLAIRGNVPDRGTVAISRTMADSLSLEVGDPLVCQAVRYEDVLDDEGNFVARLAWYANITYEVSEIWTQDSSAVQDRFSYVGSDPANNLVIRDMLNPVMLNLEDAGELLGQVAALGASKDFLPSIMNFYIWIDRAKVITVADIAGTIDRLEFIYNRLVMEGQPYHLYVEDSQLTSPLKGLDPQLSLLKGLAVVLSLPVIALGVYLSLVGVDLGLTERRREVGILKSRGASNRQVLGSLMLESVVVGVIASAVGLLLGVLVSRFLLSTVTTFGAPDSTAEAAVSWSDLRVSPWTIVLSVLLGIALMLLSTYRPFKRVSRASVSQALHHYSPMSVHTSYNPWLDFALIGLSITSIVSVLLGMNAAYGRGFSWIAESILTVVLVMGVVTFPIMPLFLSMGIVRLMTMGSRKLYANLTALVKPWTRELTYLVNKNIARNPRRASNLGVIISLALAFGLFISITMESTFAQEQEAVKFEVGADVNVAGTHSSRWIPVEYSDLGAVDSLPGVEHASHYVVLTSTSFLGTVPIAVLNSSDYLDTVNPGDFYFIGHENKVLADLEENGTCLITRERADAFDILEGDVLNVNVAWASQLNSIYKFTRIPLQLKVIGIVKAMPGLTFCSIFIDSGTLAFASFSEMASSEAMVGVFLKTTLDSNPNAVAASAVTTFSSANVNATAVVFKDQLNALGADPTYRAISDFLYTQYALALVIMSVGVGLIIFVAVSDREHELACIMARGSSRSQMRRMLMGESISLMSLGLIVGTSVGLLTAYLFNTLWGDETAQFDRSMVFTTVSWLVLAMSIISLLVASLLATSRAGKVRLAEVLRIRGG